MKVIKNGDGTYSVNVLNGLKMKSKLFVISNTGEIREGIFKGYVTSTMTDIVCSYSSDAAFCERISLDKTFETEEDIVKGVCISKKYPIETKRVTSNIYYRDEARAFSLVFYYIDDHGYIQKQTFETEKYDCSGKPMFGLNKHHYETLEECIKWEKYAIKTFEGKKEFKESLYKKMTDLTKEQKECISELKDAFMHLKKCNLKPFFDWSGYRIFFLNGEDVNINETAPGTNLDDEDNLIDIYGEKVLEHAQSIDLEQYIPLYDGIDYKIIATLKEREE